MHVLFEEIIKKIAIFRARLILRWIYREDFPEQTPRQCGPGPLFDKKINNRLAFPFR
jgi:hypothetical protein